MKKLQKPSAIEARTQALREAIAGMDFVVSGMVSTRMKPCGKVNCRCAKDPSAQHGPYREWHHYQDGRLMHKTVTPDQYAILEGAVANHREILRLLAVWEQETVDLVLSKPYEQKTRSGKTR
jgi:hypothetical protein